MREKMLASNSSIFDQVRKSSSAPGFNPVRINQLNRRERNTSRNPCPEHLHFHAMNEQFARQARSAEEQLEMVRLTGKMTSESARPQDLAEAATVLLENNSTSVTRKLDESTRKPRSPFAVWSVGVSAVIAVVVLVASAAAASGPERNGTSGDKFQADCSRQSRMAIPADRRVDPGEPSGCVLLSDSLSKPARTDLRVGHWASAKRDLRQTSRSGTRSSATP